MRYSKIYNKKTGQSLIMVEDADFEFVNPITHFRDSYFCSRMIGKGISIEELKGQIEPTSEGRKASKEILSEWDKQLEKFKTIEIPDNLLALLSATKKNEQTNLLKGIAINPDILIAFIIKAHEMHGYTLSQYTSEHTPKDVDKSKLPRAIRLDNKGSVEAFGSTELTQGQLKHVVQHNKRTVAKFLDKGDLWHCLFINYHSLRGQEKWLGKYQPHYHYISNSFGIDRDKVIQELKSEQYNLGNLPHIKFENYGNQPL